MSRVPLGVTVGFLALGLMVLAGPASAQAAASDDYSFGIHLMILGLCVMPGLYFLPSILAATRDHPAANRIFVVNLLLGWTVVGWGVALVWVLMAKNQMAKNLAPVVLAQPVPQPLTLTPKLSLVDMVAQEIEDLARQKLQLQLSDDEYNQRKQAILDRWRADTALAAPQRL